MTCTYPFSIVLRLITVATLARRGGDALRDARSALRGVLPNVGRMWPRFQQSSGRGRPKLGRFPRVRPGMAPNTVCSACWTLRHRPELADIGRRNRPALPQAWSDPRRTWPTSDQNRWKALPSWSNPPRCSPKLGHCMPSSAKLGPASRCDFDRSGQIRHVSRELGRASFRHKPKLGRSCPEVDRSEPKLAKATQVGQTW